MKYLQLWLWAFVALVMQSITWATKMKDQEHLVVEDGRAAVETLPPASFSASMHQLFSNETESPNLMDVFARLPGVPEAFSSQASKRTKKVAVCVAGHLRTFIEPGVHSALATHVVQQAAADTYIVGHLGAYAATESAKHGSGYQAAHAGALGNAGSPEIKNAVSFAGLNTKKTHITTGDCGALQAAWQQAGVTGRTCRPNGNFMQVMWIDHCIRMIRASGVAYDLVVRTRPDIGVFQPVDLNGLPSNQISFMPKDANGRADWFFAIPMPLVNTWWNSIANMYAGGNNGLPDYTIFKSGPMHQTQFPAAITRTPADVECFRLMDQSLRSACEAVVKDGHYFGDQVH